MQQLDSWQKRITLNPDVLGGRPTIRNMRFGISDLLSLLASGMMEREILDDYSYLEAEDIKAALEYASRISKPGEVWLMAS